MDRETSPELPPIEEVAEALQMTPQQKAAVSGLSIESGSLNVHSKDGTMSTALSALSLADSLVDDVMLIADSGSSGSGSESMPEPLEQAPTTPQATDGGR